MAKKTQEPKWDKGTSFNLMIKVYLAARNFVDADCIEHQIEARANLVIECDKVRDHLRPPNKIDVPILEGL